MNKITTSEEFNNKYSAFLEEGFDGLTLNDKDGLIVSFLDKLFEDLTKIPGFKYQQIKIKFGSSRFYAEPLSSQTVFMIEEKLDKIIKSLN
ncbi:MAG: hypothetical protein RSE41_00845 [Clostridia bacterium]